VPLFDVLQTARKKTVTSGQDVLVLAIIGGLLVTGLLLEGMRILETGIRVSVALPSFLGYPFQSCSINFRSAGILFTPTGGTFMRFLRPRSLPTSRSAKCFISW